MIDLTSLQPGYQFPTTTLHLDSATISAYVAAVEDPSPLYAGDSALVPPLAVLALAMRGLTDVLQAVAEKSGWGKPLPKGRARGVACHRSFGTYVAQVAEVSAKSDGSPKVERVFSAVDCGVVINPNGAEAQSEGAIAYGLSAALYGAITIKDGAVEQTNFDGYQVLRMSDMPEVEVYLVPNGDDPGGLGEPGVPPIAPAVANAMFALNGKRLRKLPFVSS